jgi:hypothetical protein
MPNAHGRRVGGRGCHRYKAVENAYARRVWRSGDGGDAAVNHEALWGGGAVRGAAAGVAPLRQHAAVAALQSVAAGDREEVLARWSQDIRTRADGFRRRRFGRYGAQKGVLDADNACQENRRAGVGGHGVRGVLRREETLQAPGAVEHRQGALDELEALRQRLRGVSMAEQGNMLAATVGTHSPGRAMAPAPPQMRPPRRGRGITRMVPPWVVSPVVPPVPPSPQPPPPVLTSMTPRNLADKALQGPFVGLAPALRASVAAAAAPPPVMAAVGGDGAEGRRRGGAQTYRASAQRVAERAWQRHCATHEV